MPLIHNKNPVVYNQIPKFKDLNFKYQFSYSKSPLFYWIFTSSSLLTWSIQHQQHPPRPTQDPPMKNRCDGCAGGGWLRRTIQLRRHLVASRLGNDCHTSTKKSSRSIETKVIKKHLRATMLVVVQTTPGPCHEQALRASDRRPSHLVKNQAGASWDEAWYVGMVSVGTTSNRVVSKGWFRLRQRRYSVKVCSFKSAPNPIDTGCTV